MTTSALSTRHLTSLLPPRSEAASLAKLRRIIEHAGMRERVPGESFQDFERRLHSQLQEVERDLLAHELVKGDVDAEAVYVDGSTFRRVVRAEETYMTAAGPVRVERTLYKDRSDDGARAIAPMDLRAGIVAGFWTPMAAQQAAWVVSQVTPQTAEELFERIGNMMPSKSSLDRLPKALAERWDEDRQGNEAALRAAIVVPNGTVSVMVALDGVLAPMKEGGSAQKRAATAGQGKVTKGPSGYREVGCATISFCDVNGDCLSAIRVARMPEQHKAGLKKWICAELAAVQRQRPDLTLVKASDGAPDHWKFLHEQLPEGVEVVDFFHASGRLSDAIAEAYGDGTTETRRRYQDLRLVLLEDPDGANKVIRALAYLRSKHPTNKSIATQLQYFRTRRNRMDYANLRARGLPVGTGVTEAACKTLVTQRMKQSGMRWGQAGGQAILNLRGWAQSDRFDRAWALLAATFSANVVLLNNVVSLEARLQRIHR